MVRMAGRPRKTSVYTLAGQRSQRRVDRPMMASSMPRAVPISAEQPARIRVLTRPVRSSSGSTWRMYSQLRNVSTKVSIVDLREIADRKAGSAGAELAGQRRVGVELGVQPGDRAVGDGLGQAVVQLG